MAHFPQRIDHGDVLPLYPAGPFRLLSLRPCPMTEPTDSPLREQEHPGASREGQPNHVGKEDVVGFQQGYE